MSSYVTDGDEPAKALETPKQILVVQDLALNWQSRHPLLPFAAHLRTPGVLMTAVPGVALLSEASVSPVGRSSLCMSYCVTDGDEPAKAPATKKKRPALPCGS